MADPVWGLLAKAQDDPQTIDEAIASAIAAHEASPEAHLGDGESLESHRANDVLDHPAGSGLADKWTMSEIEYSTNFENIDLFSTEGVVSPVFPGFAMNPTMTGSAHWSSLILPMEERNIFVNLAKAFLFQFAFNADHFYGNSTVINFGWTYGPQEKNGVGLEITGSNVRFYVTDDGGGSPAYLNWPSFTDIQTYVVRIQNVPDEGVIKVYINGELLGTLSPPNPTASDASAGVISFERTSLSGDPLNILYMYLSFEP